VWRYCARPALAARQAQVEVAVQIAQRWIVARMRNETFFSLAELNERIAELLEDLNNRVMRRYGKTRRQLFEELDRPALRPLPAQRFVWGDWKNAGVNIDYTSTSSTTTTSVPFTLVHERVDARFTASTVEIFYKSRRVASARAAATCVAGTPRTRSTCRKSTATTAEWTPTRMLRWAETVGPKTAGTGHRDHRREAAPRCTATAPAWASCDWGRRYASHDLRPASARAVSCAHVRSSASSRS